MAILDEDGGVAIFPAKTANAASGQLRSFSVFGANVRSRGQSRRRSGKRGGLLLAEAVEKLASWELPAIA